MLGIFNVSTDANACDCTRGCTDAVGESALKIDAGRKSLAAPGNRTCISGLPVRCSTIWATSPPWITKASPPPSLFCCCCCLKKKKKFLWFFIVIVVIVITIRNHHCHFSLLLPVELDTSVLSASSTTVSPPRHPSLSLCPFDGVRLCFSFLCPSVSVSLALSLFVRLSPSVYVSLFFSRLFFSAPSPQPHQLNWVLS